MDLNHDQTLHILMLPTAFFGINSDKQFILEEISHARAEAALEVE